MHPTRQQGTWRLEDEQVVVTVGDESMRVPIQPGGLQIGKYYFHRVSDECSEMDL